MVYCTGRQSPHNPLTYCTNDHNTADGGEHGLVCLMPSFFSSGIFSPPPPLPSSILHLPHFIHPASVHSSSCCALQRGCRARVGGGCERGVSPPTHLPTHAGKKKNLINEHQPAYVNGWSRGGAWGRFIRCRHRALRETLETPTE